MDFLKKKKDKITPGEDVGQKEDIRAREPEELDQEDMEPQIHVPPVEAPFSDLKGGLAYFGFSQRGSSHLETDLPCQDRCAARYLEKTGHLIMAVADGVGSCALSDLGAHTAVKAVLDHIQLELNKLPAGKLDGAGAGVILRSAMLFAYDEVERAARENEQLLYSLQSTLTVAIYDGTDLFFGHAGDDGIVALTTDGTLAMATSRHKGEEASSVYPLQEKKTWQFGMVPKTVAFVMATDGVLDAFVRSHFEKERVYYPFIEPIFTAAYHSKADVTQMCDDLFQYMEDKEYRSVVTDDLTITVAMNLDKLPGSLPKFDIEAWRRDTKTYDDKVQAALYGEGTAPTGNASGDKEAPLSPEEKPALPAVVEPAGPAKKRTKGFFDTVRKRIRKNRMEKNRNEGVDRRLEPYCSMPAGSAAKEAVHPEPQVTVPAAPAYNPRPRKRRMKWDFLKIAVAAFVLAYLLLMLILGYQFIGLIKMIGVFFA